MGEKEILTIKGTLEWKKNDVSPYPGQVVFSINGPDIQEYLLNRELRVKNNLFDAENTTFRTVVGEITVTFYRK